MGHGTLSDDPTVIVVETAETLVNTVAHNSAMCERSQGRYLIPPHQRAAVKNMYFDARILIIGK